MVDPQPSPTAEGVRLTAWTLKATDTVHRLNGSGLTYIVSLRYSRTPGESLL